MNFDGLVTLWNLNHALMRLNILDFASSKFRVPWRE